ncbi:MAG TPA: hypothetical protein VKN14_14335 [Flavobacteriaceae bacterium]|nr:hypothetical protein [Flavobacteriaceae bacterium]
MKNNIYFFLLILVFGCQNSGTEIYSEEFKWRVTIPENYESIPLTEKTQEKGKRIIEEAYNQKIKIVAIPVFNFMKGKTNKFQAQFTELDSIQNFLTEFNKANEIFETSFKYKMPESEYRTEISTKSISGLEFKTFEMKIYGKNNVTTTFKNFSRLFDNKKLDILIVYQDEKNGNELISALEKSEFE